MLAKAHRLTGAEAFATTIRRGGRTGSSTLVVHLLVSSDGLPPRVGLVVSRAVGDAVTRNRVKRQLRHAAGAHLDDLPMGTMLVLRALPPAAEVGFSALVAELERSVRRLRER